MLRIFIVLFLIMELSACFIAPGMQMQSPPVTAESVAAPYQIQPTFIPIDVSLVRNMNRFARINQDDAYYYHVGAHDILNIYVWGHPELNGPIGQVATEQGTNAAPTLAPVGYLVSSDGTIFFPMVGTVHVAGQTVEQNRQSITHRLKRYIRNPQLEVRVTGFRSKKIYVMGEVYKPGLLPITDSPMNIADAINLAGGMDRKTADASHIFIIRGDYARPKVYWLNAHSPDTLLLAENFRLKNNDVVYVSTAEVARWNRAIDQILPTIQTIWFTRSLITQ